MTLISTTPSTELLELRDKNAAPVVLFTGDGVNGVRAFLLRDSGRTPVDLTGKALKMLIKTSLQAADDELGAFPINASNVVAGAGTFDIDLSPINFPDPLPEVFVILYDDSSGKKVVEAISRTTVKRGGVV